MLSRPRLPGLTELVLLTMARSLQAPARPRPARPVTNQRNGNREIQIMTNGHKMKSKIQHGEVQQEIKTLKEDERVVIDDSRVSIETSILHFEILTIWMISTVPSPSIIY